MLIANIVIVAIGVALYFAWNKIPEIHYNLDSVMASDSLYKYRLDMTLNLNIEDKEIEINDTTKLKHNVMIVHHLAVPNSSNSTSSLVNNYVYNRFDSLRHDFKKLEKYNLKDYKYVALFGVQSKNLNQSWIDDVIHYTTYKYWSFFNSPVIKKKVGENGRNITITKDSIPLYSSRYENATYDSFSLINEDNCIDILSSTSETYPHFYSAFDISQAKIHIAFNQSKAYFGNYFDSSVDSLSKITIDFNTAVSLLPIFPVPDEIGPTYIKYTSPEKVKTIYKEEGLDLYATFPHMQNIQVIRFFLLTTILSFSLHSIIITLISIIFGKKKEKKDQNIEQ